MLDCRRGIVHNGQLIQVSVVCLQGDFPIAEKIGNTLPHRNPLHDPLVFTSNFLSEFEFLGVIDNHFHPKNRTGFVYIFSQFSLTRCFILAPGIRRRHPPSFISEMISPGKPPCHFLPRKLMTSLAPKHNVLWRNNRGKSSLKSEVDLKTMSVEYSLCDVTQ
jgi:hypothetical protein